MNFLKTSIQLDGRQGGERIFDFRLAHLHVTAKDVDPDLALATDNVPRHLDFWNGTAQGAAETIPTQAHGQPLELEIFRLDSKRKGLGIVDQIGPYEVADFNRAAIDGKADRFTKSQRIVPQGDRCLNLRNRLSAETKRFDRQCSGRDTGRDPFACCYRQVEAEGQSEIHGTDLPSVGFNTH